MKYAINAAQAPDAYGSCSQGTTAGRFVYTSGQLPVGPDGKTIVGAFVATQTSRVIDIIDCRFSPRWAARSRMLRRPPSTWPASRILRRWTRSLHSASRSPRPRARWLRCLPFLLVRSSRWTAWPAGKRYHERVRFTRGENRCSPPTTTPPTWGNGHFPHALCRCYRSRPHGPGEAGPPHADHCQGSPDW